MAGKIIDGVKYILLHNKNDLKKKSLEDNVYFTLRDIFCNADINDVFTANHYNRLLTNGISFEERDSSFKYTNLLYDYNSNYTQNLVDWLCTTYPSKTHSFEFYPLDEDNEIDMKKYMKLDDWWVQFEYLREKLKRQLVKHKVWEAEDVERDCDRLTELEDDF